MPSSSGSSCTRKEEARQRGPPTDQQVVEGSLQGGVDSGGEEEGLAGAEGEGLAGAVEGGQEEGEEEEDEGDENDYL